MFCSSMLIALHMLDVIPSVIGQVRYLENVYSLCRGLSGEWPLVESRCWAGTVMLGMSPYRTHRH